MDFPLARAFLGNEVQSSAALHHQLSCCWLLCLSQQDTEGQNPAPIFPFFSCSFISGCGVYKEEHRRTSSQVLLCEASQLSSYPREREIVPFIRAEEVAAEIKSFCQSRFTSDPGRSSNLCFDNRQQHRPFKANALQPADFQTGCWRGPGCHQETPAPWKDARPCKCCTAVLVTAEHVNEGRLKAWRTLIKSWLPWCALSFFEAPTAIHQSLFPLTTWLHFST